MNATEDCAAGEFSRTIAIERIGAAGAVRELSAGASERAALARRFDLMAIDSLTAKVTLERHEASHKVTVSGSLNAAVVQSCVVTMEPVANHVEGDFSVAYTTVEDTSEPERDMAPDADVAPDADDQPDFLEGDEIDIGEVIAEHLGLFLDPYPRRPGVVFSSEDETDPAQASPFAVLRDLKKD